MNRDAVIAILLREKPFLERECGVVSLALFGSAARDQMTEKSDVDVLVEFTRPITSKKYFDAQFRLEDALGTAVDLVIMTSLKPNLRPFVEKDAIVVD
jgi:predicted nucleotidyltransferase